MLDNIAFEMRYYISIQYNNTVSSSVFRTSFEAMALMFSCYRFHFFVISPNAECTLISPL